MYAEKKRRPGRIKKLSNEKKAEELCIRGYGRPEKIAPFGLAVTEKMPITHANPLPSARTCTPIDVQSPGAECCFCSNTYWDGKDQNKNASSTADCF